MLWFAFILLSLSYWKQPVAGASALVDVVICFHFTIFVVLETTPLGSFTHIASLWFAFILLSLSYWKQPIHFLGMLSSSCDLLSFYYLCRTGNNLLTGNRDEVLVVIYFHFTIFVVLETTSWVKPTDRKTLWFAFILLSLSYWKQQVVAIWLCSLCCDLLSFYYLCRTGNNCIASSVVMLKVVICFHFTIFVVLETTQSVLFVVCQCIIEIAGI